jgi:subtilisin
MHGLHETWILGPSTRPKTAREALGGSMRRLLAAVLALLVAAPVGSVLGAGTALAAATGPALVPAALDGSAAVRAGSLDASDRWIVVLRHGSGLEAAAARANGLGVRQDRVLNGAVRGYAARLTTAQLSLLRADPHVEEVVPDDIVSMTGQTTPTGVSRVFGAFNPITHLDGTDHRVDADVAIVDTGIDPHHQDLNVAGGINCSTSDPAAWYDSNGHGTHVAGTVGALDNGIGVVGVAPGVRLWAVRILDPLGNGLLSWYVCGLNWIAAQHDPVDPTRPLFEAVNMSVQKPGHDDGDCGNANGDVMHRAVCGVVAAGVTVVAAAGNNRASASNWIPAAYREVITVSALADTDGLPGGRGGHACYSWNSYDQDDTFADFSNYGPAIDLIAPGKCILSTLPGNRYGTMSGTSMAAPLVTGAVALYKSSRPLATPEQVKAALVAMGNLDWKTSTDPDPVHEPLLDVSRIVDLGDFAVRSLTTQVWASAAGTSIDVPMELLRAEDVTFPVDLALDATAPVAGTLSTAHFEAADPGAFTVAITVPPGLASGAYPVTVTASDGARQRTATVRVLVDADPPVVSPAVIGAIGGRAIGTASLAVAASWPAAADPSGVVAGYEARWSVDRGPWGSPTALGAGSRSLSRTAAFGHTYALEVRARDAAGNWSAWAASRVVKPFVVQDWNRAISKSGPWYRAWSRSASGGSVSYSRRAGAAYAMTFWGQGIAVVAPRGVGRGRFAVYLDGRRVAIVDQRASSYLARQVLYARAGLASGTHRLRVVALWTLGRQRIDLDALIVLR